MKVSANKWKGAKIDDLNELVQLAEDQESVVVQQGNSFIVRPAAWVLNWTINYILSRPIFHAIDFDPDLK